MAKSWEIQKHLRVARLTTELPHCVLELTAHMKIRPKPFSKMGRILG